MPITSVDVLPTIAGAAGVELPENVELDGLDLRPVLEGGAQLDRSALYWHFPHYRHAPGPYSIIREGDWKLIKWYEGPMSLFNLKEDLGEKNDLAAEMPGKVKALESRLMTHLQSVDARIPIPNPNARQK